MRDVDDELWCGDSLLLLGRLPDASVDAIVTDPPFGIGFDYRDAPDVATNAGAYWEWLRPRYDDMLRVLRPGGFLALWQTQVYFRYFWDWFGADIHIYCAAKNFVQLRKTPINYGYDPVVLRYKPGALPLRPSQPQRSMDFFVANTAAVIRDTTRIEKAHPCPRPLDAVAEVVRNFTLPGGLVLDPFLGSGTTAVACIQEGRRYLGIEQSEAYCRLAHERVQRARAEQCSAA